VSLLLHFVIGLIADGSLAREHVRDQYFDKSWDKFNDAVNSRRPKSADDLPKQAGFYWLLPDIIVCPPSIVLEEVLTNSQQTHTVPTNTSHPLHPPLPKKYPNSQTPIQTLYPSWKRNS
jgi:hypothetical protein